MALADIEAYLRLVPVIKQASQSTVWLSYNQEAATLYINFKKPSYATDSELMDDDVIVRYESNEVVGFTVLHASQR
jgi:uncharacterized protein YuzE